MMMIRAKKGGKTGCCVWVFRLHPSCNCEQRQSRVEQHRSLPDTPWHSRHRVCRPQPATQMSPPVRPQHYLFYCELKTISFQPSPLKRSTFSLSFSLSMNYEQKPCRALLVCLSLTNTNKRKLARKNVRPYLETVYSRLCKCLQFHPTSSTEMYWVIVHWAEKLPVSSASKSDSLYRCGNVGGWYVSLGEGNTLNISDKKIPATVTDVTLVANRDSGW